MMDAPAPPPLCHELKDPLGVTPDCLPPGALKRMPIAGAGDLALKYLASKGVDLAALGVT